MGQFRERRVFHPDTATMTVVTATGSDWTQADASCLATGLMTFVFADPDCQQHLVVLGRWETTDIGRVLGHIQFVVRHETGLHHHNLPFQPHLPE